MLPPVSVDSASHTVVSFRVLPETRMLSLISNTGDITTVSLHEDGDVEGGESTTVSRYENPAVILRKRKT
jgi:hypothetical protein